MISGLLQHSWLAPTWLVVIAACQAQTSAISTSTDGGGSPDSGLVCSPTLPILDDHAFCTDGSETAVGLCFNEPPASKGLYWLCAIAPDGRWFYVNNLPGNWTIASSPGWRFGPAWLANNLHVAAVSGAEDQRCQAAIQAAHSQALPACEQPDTGIDSSGVGGEAS